MEPTADEDWECQRLQEAGEEIPASRHALGDIQAALPSPEPGLSSAHRCLPLSVSPAGSVWGMKLRIP